MSQREQAAQLRAKLLKNMESRKGFRRDMIDAVTKIEWDAEWDEIIAAALADERRIAVDEFLAGDRAITQQIKDARRAVWEEAAKVICPFCNDPEWCRLAANGSHISPITGGAFVCLAQKIRAKAQEVG